MKIHFTAICFLVLLTGVRTDNPSKPETLKESPVPQNYKSAAQPVPSRKNVQVSTPLPFSQDMSTKPIGQQAYAAFQAGFPNAFGSFATHNPNAPSFSVDPMISSGSINLAQAGNRGAGFGNQGMFMPPHIRNDHSLTRYSDDDLLYGGASLSAVMSPRMRTKDKCELVQRQAVQVANNLVKRQNKIIFKEVMNYILKSKFLIGMTEVKLNRVLRRKFVAVMKKYSVISDDNVRLISSEDDEILDDELGDEDDDLQANVDYQDPFKSNAIDIQEDNIDWRDVNNNGESITEDQAREWALNGNAPQVVSDPLPVSDPENAKEGDAGKDKDKDDDSSQKKEKKPWYKRIFDWKQQRALQARQQLARQQQARQQRARTLARRSPK